MIDTTIFLGSGQSASDVTAIIRSAFTHMDFLNRPDDLLNALGQLPLVMAGVMVVTGLLCVLNGYRWHRWVVVILAFMGGMFLGSLLAPQVGRPAIVALSVGALSAIVATPLLRVVVAIFGGLTGAFIGANAWTAFNAAEADMHWAGAAIGFITLAMASFVLFRLVIVLFTSVGGAAMLVFGGITLMMHVDGWESPVRDTLAQHELVIPLLLAIGAVGGVVLQSSWHPEALAKANQATVKTT